jgi:UPF0716 protein FxsA
VVILLIIFIVIPLVEIAVLIRVGARIGILPTLGLMVLMSIIGGLLARYQGLKTWQRIQQDLAAGRIPDDALLDSFIIFVGGMLMLTPGFVTDLIGLWLLLPGSRQLVKWLLRRQMTAWIAKSSRDGESGFKKYDDIDLN